jgi:hypothetical protein
VDGREKPGHDGAGEVFHHADTTFNSPWQYRAIAAII